MTTRSVTRSLLLALVALLVSATGAWAAAGVQLRGVDATGFPTIRASIVAPPGFSSRPAVRENGGAVAGLQEQNLGRVKAIVLAVDRSQSMRGQPLADASAAARAFVGRKQRQDEVAIVAFGSHAATVSPFSAVTLDSVSALSNLRTDSEQGTALFDAVAVSARQLKNHPLPGRVLIVLTDGADKGSKRSLEAAIAEARAANVVVYTIGIEGTTFSSAPLVELAQATGGQYYGAAGTSNLAAVYGSIGESLKRTWRVQYFTKARPGDRIRLDAAVVGAGGASTSLKIPHSPDEVTAPAPSKLVPKGAYGPGGPLSVGLAVGALMLVAAIIFLAAIRGSWLLSRIAPHTGETKVTLKKKRRANRRAMLANVYRMTERWLGDLKQWRMVSRMLERADIPLKTAEFFWISVGAACGPAFLAAVAGLGAAMVFIFFIVGGLAPFSVVWLKMRKRLRAFENQLPDVLITIAAALKAGHSFKQGLQSVVDEGHPPASDMFKRVLTETQLGRPMDDALAEMAERAGSKNFEFAITAVTIQRQVGGSLASLFDMVADTVRQRQQFARKIRSLTAMGRMSAYVLVGIPFFLAGMISVVNPEYISPLYHTHGGHMLLMLGLVMMAIGSMLLKKIVSFRG